MRAHLKRPRPTIVHVIPTRDLQPHVESLACPCEPRVEPANDGEGLVVVHHSYDGRELVERHGLQ